MTPYFDNGNGITLYAGDCRGVIATFDAGSVDACVTDAPYDLTAKSRNGSQRQNDPATPFGRHRLQSAGGFMGQRWDATGVAFDPATWDAVYRVLKPGAYLIAFGGTRTYHRMACAIEDAGFEIKDCLCWLYGSGMPKHTSLLKPAWEPIVLAKKRGQGAINRDACRIGGANTHRPNGTIGYHGGGNGRGSIGGSDSGRVPANVILDEMAAAILDASVPPSISRIGKPRKSEKPGNGWGATHTGAEYADDGGPSRFFYCPKVDDDERNRGLPIGMVNNHPTVKPASLMQWLVKLVALPGQTIIDPFCGSGTTGIACNREGILFRGIDLSDHYLDISRYRIVGDAPLFSALPIAHWNWDDHGAAK